MRNYSHRYYAGSKGLGAGSFKGTLRGIFYIARLCKRTGALGVKRREATVRRHAKLAGIKQESSPLATPLTDQRSGIGAI